MPARAPRRMPLGTTWSDSEAKANMYSRRTGMSVHERSGERVRERVRREGEKESREDEERRRRRSIRRYSWKNDARA